MATRLNIPIDKSSRASLKKLGFEEGMAVAEELPDGSGWILRPARVLTEAELDVLSSPENVASLKEGMKASDEGLVQPRFSR